MQSKLGNKNIFYNAKIFNSVLSSINKKNNKKKKNQYN